MNEPTRDIFDNALVILGECDEDSPEFHYAFAIIQAYRVFVLEKRLEKECQDDLSSQVDKALSESSY